MNGNKERNNLLTASAEFIKEVDSDRISWGSIAEIVHFLSALNIFEEKIRNAVMQWRKFMKTWPWRKIGLRLLLSPLKFMALRKLPKKFVTLDEWHEANLAKAEIAASVISCKCVHDLKKQEEEFTKYRKSICTTTEEWFRVADKPDHDNAIRRIIEKYRQQKKCHRDFYEPQAGIRCYCDEHSH